MSSMQLLTTDSGLLLIILTIIQIAAAVFIMSRFRRCPQMKSGKVSTDKSLSEGVANNNPCSGITIVIAMFIVLMFMIQMSNIMEMTTNSVELHKGYLTTRQAYYNARSGLELGLLSVSDPDEFEKVRTGRGIQYEDGKYQLVFSDGSGAGGNSAVASGVTWEIKNKANDIPTKYNENGAVTNGTSDGWQIFPFPGTGTLGGGDCEIEQWKNKDMQDKNKEGFKKSVAIFEGVYNQENFNFQTYTSPSESFLDHPCFWNTLNFSETATIPLYTKGKDCEDFEGEKICNPKDIDAKGKNGLNLTELIIKIRTPCKNGKKVCVPDGNFPKPRYELSSDFDTEKVVLWGITATCQIKEESPPSSCYFTGAGPVGFNEKSEFEKHLEQALPMSVADKLGSSIKKKSLPKISWITGYVLNKSGDIFDQEYKYWTLDFSDKYADDLKNLYKEDENGGEFASKKPTILSAIKGESPWTTYLDSNNPIFKNITKPKLILEIAALLKDNSNPEKEIQNLEYQILYKTSSNIASPIADPVIVADGYHKNFHSKLQVKMSTLGAGFSYVAIPTD